MKSKILHSKEKIFWVVILIVLLIFISWWGNFMLNRLGNDYIDSHPERSRLAFRVASFSPFSDGSEYAYKALTYSNPDDLPYYAYTELMEELEGEVDLEKSIDLYRRALEEGVEREWIYHNLAEIYFLKADYERKNHFDFFRSSPEKALDYGEKSYQYYQEAEAASPGYSLDEYRVGYLLTYVLRNYNRGVGYLRTAKEDQDNLSVRNRLSETNIRLGDYERAAELSESVAENARSRSRRAEGLTRRAVIEFYYFENPERAIEILEEASEVANNPLMQYYYLIRVHEHINNSEIAEEYLDVLRDEFERGSYRDSLEMLVDRAENLLEPPEELEDLLSFTDELLEFPPESPMQREWVYLQRGKAYYEHGNLEEASEYFFDVLDLNSKNKEALYHQVLIFLEREEEELAQNFLAILKEEDTEGRFDERISDLEEDLEN